MCNLLVQLFKVKEANSKGSALESQYKYMEHELFLKKSYGYHQMLLCNLFELLKLKS